jgi:sulfoxide reductase heme-binding subunit YedZ
MAELEQASPAWWHFLLPLAILGLDIAVAVSGTGQQTVWYVVRATGVIAYVLLALSVVIGLVISNRLLPGGRIKSDVFEAHSFMTLLVLAFGGFHALALLVDSYVGFSPREILVPFTSTYRPASVGLGILGLYSAAIVYASFWARKMIGYQAWRALHYTAFFTFVAVTLHGIFSGADAGAGWMIAIYVLSITAVTSLTSWRILTAED